MKWRTWAVMGALVLGSGMTGCDCVGCSSKEVARAEGDTWSVAVACETRTRIGGVGAGHVGGILYPDGCDVEWEVRIESHTERLKADVPGPRIDGHACTEVRAFCKQAKGSVVTRTEQADVVAVASTNEAAVGFYVFDPGAPLRWPSSELAGNQPAWRGPVGPAVEAGRSGDAQRLLAAMPPAEALLTQMLTDAIPLDDRVLAALEGPRLERHLAEVRGAVTRCVIPNKTIERVARAHPEITDDVYRAAFPRNVAAPPCASATSWLREAKPRSITPRVIDDLRTCDAACPAGRLRELALLADALDSKEAAALLAAKHLTAPAPAAWEKNASRAREAYLAWFAATYAVARLDPAAARGPLLAQLTSASTRGVKSLPFDDSEGEDDGDAGPKASPGPPGGDEEEGVFDDAFPLVKASSGLILGGSLAVMLRDVAELLLVADAPSVHEAVFALAGAPKRDRGVRQVAIAYLVATADPRAEALVAQEGVLTEGQRANLRPKPAPAPAPAAAGSGEHATPTPTPRSHRRHHHH